MDVLKYRDLFVVDLLTTGKYYCYNHEHIESCVRRVQITFRKGHCLLKIKKESLIFIGSAKAHIAPRAGPLVSTPNLSLKFFHSGCMTIDFSWLLNLKEGQICYVEKSF